MRQHPPHSRSYGGYPAPQGYPHGHPPPAQPNTYPSHHGSAGASHPHGHQAYPGSPHHPHAAQPAGHSGGGAHLSPPAAGHGGLYAILHTLQPGEGVVSFIPRRDGAAVFGRWLIGFVVAMAGIAFLLVINAKAKGLVALPAILGALAMRSAITANERAPLGLLVTTLRTALLGPKGETVYEYDLRQIADVDGGSPAGAGGAKTDPSHWRGAKRVTLVDHHGRRQALESLPKGHVEEVGSALANVLQGRALPTLSVEDAVQQLRKQQQRGSNRGSLLTLASIVMPVVLIAGALGALVSFKKARERAFEEEREQEKARVEAEAANREKKDLTKAGDAAWIYRAGKAAGYGPEFTQWGVELSNPYGIGHRAFLLREAKTTLREYTCLSVHEFDFSKMKPAPGSGATFVPIFGKSSVLLIQSSSRMSELKPILAPLADDWNRPISKDLEAKGWSSKRSNLHSMKVGDTSLTEIGSVIEHEESGATVEYVTIPLTLAIVRGKKVWVIASESSTVQQNDRFRLADELKERALGKR